MSFEAGQYCIADLMQKKFLEIGDGYRAKNEELSLSGLPFARAGNVNDGFRFDNADFFPEQDLHKVGNKISKVGDVVFTSKGTVGRFALVHATTPQFVYSPQLCFWRSLRKDVLLPEYLYYWMNSAEFLRQIDYLKGQTDMADYVSLRDQRNITATIPAINAQRAVVNVMMPIDARITLLRQTNDTLEAIAQALFKSWFVDFDPVRAKLEGNPPEGIDEVTAALFPDSFMESTLGIIPSGWQVGRVEDLMELAYGKALKASDRTAGSVPVYGSGGITGLHNQALVPTPSIIIGRKGTVGTLYWENRPFLPIDTVFYVKTSKPLTYCFYQLARLGLKDMNTDGAVPGLNRKNVYRLGIVLPPDRMLSAFDAIASVLRRKIFSNNEQIIVLSTLRDTLLPRLISGQLNLTETEKILEKVAA